MLAGSASNYVLQAEPTTPQITGSYSSYSFFRDK